MELDCPWLLSIIIRYNTTHEEEAFLQPIHVLLSLLIRQFTEQLIFAQGGAKDTKKREMEEEQKRDDEEVSVLFSSSANCFFFSALETSQISSQWESGELIDFYSTFLCPIIKRRDAEAAEAAALLPLHWDPLRPSSTQRAPGTVQRPQQQQPKPTRSTLERREEGRPRPK